MNFENYGYEREKVTAKDDWITGRNPYGSGRDKKWQPYTEEQYQKGAELIAKVCQKYKLDPAGKTGGHDTIVGHDYVTAKVRMNSNEPRPLNVVRPPEAKSDPGPAFDYAKIKRLAKNKM